MFFFQPQLKAKVIKSDILTHVLCTMFYVQSRKIKPTYSLYLTLERIEVSGQNNHFGHQTTDKKNLLFKHEKIV